MLRDPFRSIVIGVLLATCASLLIRPFWSHDTWWHVKCGELIVRDHVWPSPDIFTCTVNGQPWLVHSWLSQCGMYLADRAMGEIGLQILGTGARLLFVFLVWRAAARSWVPLPVRLLVAGNAAFFCAVLEYRPHLLVPALLTLLVVSADLRRPDRPVPLWTVPLMALWSNIHPSILLGEFFLGVCLIQRWVHPAPLRPARNTVVLLLALLAGFLNPYHFRLIHFSLFENRAYGYVTINEWLSPLSQLPGSIIDVLVLTTNTLILIWLLIGFFKTRRFSQIGVQDGLRSREFLHDLLYALTPCIFALTAYAAFRFMFLSTIAVLPFLHREESKKSQVNARIPAFNLFLSTHRIYGALIVYFLLLTIGKPIYSRDWFELKRATARLRSIGAEGNIFNDFSFGGRIIYDCYPSIKVFADGRIGPFEKQVFALYKEVLEGPKERALAILDSYDVDWLLIQESLEPGWMNEREGFREVYRRSGIVIFRREKKTELVDIVFNPHLTSPNLWGRNLPSPPEDRGEIERGVEFALHGISPIFRSEQ